ncbi:pyridoxamine 5'-phosphate oxidase family protein [Sungkyunkwania multivorans]|uniref:Pyridoxamine 5'-phosphate oxidase family protein n=1 Tax=Sungkyunkwania multivorans TaxID=1173618 RepID=A0ABW3CU35_9FLAO
MDVIFASIIKDLKIALKDKSHPYRYFTLATVGFNNTPRLRTVVLRDMDEDMNMFIYTDRRSKKITHITENNKVSLLFFNPEKSLQVSVKATAHLVRDDQELSLLWKKIPKKARKDYTTSVSPGQEIKNPDEVDYLDTISYFSVIKIRPEKIEYLHLKNPNHIRVEFRKTDDNTWKGNYIAP